MDRIKRFLFTNTSIKQTIAKNTFWLFLAEATGRLLKIGLIVYAARTLGVDGWGAFSYALSTGAILMMFAEIGFNNLIMREAIQQREGYKEFITVTLSFKAVLLIVSTLITIVLGPLVSSVPAANHLFTAIAFVLLFDALRDLCFAINRVSEKMEREMVVKTIMNVLILGLGILLVALQKSPLAIALAYAIGGGIGVLVIGLYTYRQTTSLITNIDRRYVTPVLHAIWPFVVINLVGTVIANIDVYLLGLLKSSSEIGLYTSVQRIQQFILILPSMISTATFPLLSRVVDDADRFSSILARVTIIMCLIGIPVCLIGIVFAPKIVTLLFGTGYIAAVPIMRVLMGGALISFPFILYSNAVFALHRQQSLAKAYLYGVVITIVCNIALIPLFGATGSAIAGVIATLAMFLSTLQALGVHVSLAQMKYAMQQLLRAHR